MLPPAFCSTPAEHLHLSYTRSASHRSIRGNNLGVEGGKLFAEALPKSSLTSLECAAAHVLAFCVQCPLTCTLPAHSIQFNNLTNQGEDMSAVLKIAEVLPQTRLTSLK